MANKSVEFKGNKTIESRLKKLSEAKQIVKGYDVGFFAQSKYQDGIPVASVAVEQEFGVSSKNVKIPERPFFKIANKNVEKPIISILDKKLTETDNYVLSELEVSRLALIHESAVKEEITKLQDPPNSPTTIKMKGSSNPLIDHGDMRRSVTYKVIK